MAEQVMAEIADELKARYDLCDVAIHDRIGRVGIGERSVVISRLGPAPGDVLAGLQATPSTTSRSACPSGRKRRTPAARNG